MDIYGNICQLFSIMLNGFAKTDYTVIKLQQKLTKTGDVMNGALNMGDDRITGVLNPSSAQDISTKIYTDNNIWA